MGAAEDFTQLPFTAWITVNGARTDVQDIRVHFMAQGQSYAVVTLPLGFPLRGGNGFAGTVNDDDEIQVFVQPEGDAEQLPGVANGLIFTGYAQTPGPHRIGGADTAVGYQFKVIHRDTMDLDTGTTATFPYVPSAGFDYQMPIRVDNSLFGNNFVALEGGSKLTQAALSSGANFAGTIKQYLNLTAQGATGGNVVSRLAKFPRCGGAVQGNEIAIAAIGRLGGTLAVSERVLNETFIRHMRSRFSEDLRLMSFHEQLQIIGQDLFFSMIPRADGTLEFQPIAAFAPKPVAAFTADQIFNYTPNGGPNRRLVGTLLLGRINGMGATRDRPVGCYTIGGGAPRGVIQSIPSPGWLVPSFQANSLQPPETLGQNLSVPVSQPQASAPTIDADREDQRLGDSGFRTAREYTRRLRYGQSTLRFSTYMRADLAPMSEVTVSSPTPQGGEVTVYGRVQSVTIQLDAQSRIGQSEYTLAFVRSAEDHNSQVGADGSPLVHPVFNDNWAGGPL